MNLEAAMFLIGVFAGTFGSMLGVGGGFIIVPLMVLILGFPMHEAVGISLASIVATSLSASIVYARENLIDFKLGLLLEIFTVAGAVIGSYTAFLLDESILKIIFGVVLMYVSYRMIVERKITERQKTRVSKSRFLAGFLASTVAGVASGMLGIGGGTIKVPILVLILGVPTRTAIATSVFMIGVTASSASFTYQARGFIEPILVGFVIIGIFIGAQLGSRLSLRVKALTLKLAFGIMLFLFAFRILLSGLGVWM